MAKKRKNRILSEDEVQAATKALRDFMTDNFPNLSKERLCVAEEVVRLHPLQHEIKSAREAMGLSVKDVSRELKVPQYRIKAIEESIGREIKPEYFWKYCRFLGLEDFVDEWIDKNKEYARKLGLVK